MLFVLMDKIYFVWNKICFTFQLYVQKIFHCRFRVVQVFIKYLESLFAATELNWFNEAEIFIHIILSFILNNFDKIKHCGFLFCFTVELNEYPYSFYDQIQNQSQNDHIIYFVDFNLNHFFYLISASLFYRAVTARYTEHITIAKNVLVQLFVSAIKF